MGLIKTNFLDKIKHNPSFYHVDCILKFFVKQANLFHKSGQLHFDTLIWIAKEQGVAIDLSMRQTVFKGIINAAVAYSCQIYSNNYNSYEDAKLNLYEALEKRNENISSWDDG